MTSNDPITAALQQLAAHHEQLTQLDARETGHFTALSERLAELTDLITGIGHTLESIEALSRKCARKACATATEIGAATYRRTHTYWRAPRETLDCRFCYPPMLVGFLRI